MNKINLRVKIKNKCKHYKNKKNFKITLLVTISIILVIGLVIAKKVTDKAKQDKYGLDYSNQVVDDRYVWPKLDVQLLTISPNSRPGRKLKRINNIVIHYVANPGTSALSNRDYFENLAKSQSTTASSHFIVGLSGEIVQCVPLSEIAYCSNNRNDDTIGIEVCHPDSTGKFSGITYDSLIQLCAWLCLRYGLKADDLIRHYDVTGKLCPKYYVEHEDAWVKLKKDVAIRIKSYPVKE